MRRASTMEIKNINIDLNIKPSKELGRKLMLSLFDYFLHSRSQIPFHSELFRKFVETKTKICDNEIKKQDWKTEQQLKLANETVERMGLLKQTIESEFIAGSPVLFVFGSTVYTAKESYEIHFPEVKDISLPTLVNEDNTVKTILLKIIQSADLKTIDSHVLPATNVFVLFRRSQSINNEEHHKLQELKRFKLSKSCRKYSIHFRDSTDFSVFNEDFQEINLQEETAGDCIGGNDEEFWYQSKAFVKGFKDVLVNNKSIWN